MPTFHDHYSVVSRNTSNAVTWRNYNDTEFKRNQYLLWNYYFAFECLYAGQWFPNFFSLLSHWLPGHISSASKTFIKHLVLMPPTDPFTSHCLLEHTHTPPPQWSSINYCWNHWYTVGYLDLELCIYWCSVLKITYGTIWPDDVLCMGLNLPGWQMTEPFLLGNCSLSPAWTQPEIP